MDSKTFDHKTLDDKTPDSKTLDSTQAIAALDDIEAVARKVRQSRFYRVSSTALVLWGVLVGAGYLVTFAAPWWARITWIGVWTAGTAGSAVVGTLACRRAGATGFDLRALAALVLFLAFGLLWTVGLVRLPRELVDVFWPTYVMLAYAIAGLWLGLTFSVIGVAVAALTLAGYFLAGPWLELWMAAVNGGGLVLGGLWMRRN